MPNPITPDEASDALQALESEVPSFPQHNINQDSTLKQVMQADVEISNMVLNGLAVGWSRAFSVDCICKLSITTMKVLESRRKLLNMQYGSESSKGGNGIVEPLD